MLNFVFEIKDATDTSPKDVCAICGATTKNQRVCDKCKRILNEEHAWWGEKNDRAKKSSA
jgi:predicted nucleic acid-binding Zn ribbon protein